jgi:hypothetical protein
MILRGVHGMLERVLHITGAGRAVHRRRRRPAVDRADRAVAEGHERADELA